MQGGFSYYDTNISDHRPVAFKFDVSSNTTTTISSRSENVMNIYPNPATTLVRIELDKSVENAVVEVYHSNGQLISTKGIDEHLLLDVSAFAKGIYTVIIRNGAEIWSKPLIIR